MGEKPWRRKLWQHQNHLRYRCRCNQRSCQARVTRAKHPDTYVIRRYSKCIYGPHCEGSLYVDWFRMWKGNMNKDRGAMCYCDGYIMPHHKHDKRCENREEFLLERSLKPKPKHHPFPSEEVRGKAPW